MRCRSWSGLEVVFNALATDGLVETFLRDEQQNELLTLELHLRMGAAYIVRANESLNDIVLFYRGGLRHPAGVQADISWFNAEGQGLLRIIDSRRKRHLLLPLIGEKVSPDAPIEPRQGVRGPSRSADLWLMATMLCLPRNRVSVLRLISTIGFSEMLVRRRLHDLADLGLIASAPSDDGERSQCFSAKLQEASAIARIGTFMRERWVAWRSGTGTGPLRPKFAYFSTGTEWTGLQPRLTEAGIRCFPSGVTYLEHGGAPYRRWLQPGGMRPELHVYVVPADVERLAHMLGTAVSNDPANGTSTLCILPPEHPAMRLHAYRTENHYVPAWPTGFAALDAIEHADPRVAEAADEAWRWWIDNQASEQSKGFA